MKIKNFLHRCLALVACLFLVLPILAAPNTPALAPKTDWLTADGWQMEASFEPLGATGKRCRYELDPAKTYVLGFVKMVAGVARRAYTDPILGSDLATPVNGKIELQLVIPTTQREFEYWIYPVPP